MATAGATSAEGGVISISHAHKLTKRRWLPNLVSMRAKLAGTTRRVRVCTRCLKAAGHQGHLSTRTNGGAIAPSRLATWWEAATPHPQTCNTYFFFLFFVAFFFISGLTLLSFWDSPRQRRQCPSPRDGGARPASPPPLVAQKVGVELWQTHHREPRPSPAGRGRRRGRRARGSARRRPLRLSRGARARRRPGRVPFEVALHGRTRRLGPPVIGRR